MADERSLIAVGRAHEGGRRFDYFVLGVAIALCAYAGQTIKPDKLGWNSYTMEVLSVVILVGAAFFGFKRVEKKVRLDELNHVILDAYEKKGKIVAHQTNRPGEPFVNVGTGDVWVAGDLETKKKDLESELSKAHDDADATHKVAERYAKWRNALLGIGFVGLFAAKVLSGYSC
jgi:hypothetical protein